MLVDTPAPFAWNYCPVCGASLECRDDGESARPNCAACQRFYYSNPVPAACALVADGDKLLFVQRAIEPCKGLWSLPGGFVELGETSEEAALRELEEETRIRGYGPNLFGASTQPSQLSGAVIVMGYWVERWEGVPSAGSDAMDAEFFESAARPELAFQAHRELVAMYDALPDPLKAGRTSI